MKIVPEYKKRKGFNLGLPLPGKFFNSDARKKRAAVKTAF